MSDIRSQIELVMSHAEDARLNVIRRSEINPMDHVCEVSADEYTRFLHDAGALAAAMEKLLARNELLEASAHRAIDLGHNDDCLFCGFKDRELTDAIAAVEAQGEKT